jgi:hypothetical protein
MRKGNPTVPYLPSGRRKHKAHGYRKRIHRDGSPTCAVCGWSIPLPLRTSAVASGINVHHILPVAHGGTDAEDNLVTLCPNHHALAHVLFPLAAYYQGPTNAADFVSLLRMAESASDAFLALRASREMEALEAKEAGRERTECERLSRAMDYAKQLERDRVAKIGKGFWNT